MHEQRLGNLIDGQKMQELSEAREIIERCSEKKYKFLDFNYQGYGNRAKAILRKVFQLLDCSKLQHYEENIYLQDNLDQILQIQFNNLESIDLCDSKIGEAGVQKLFEKQWPALKKIRLIGNNIGDGGLKILLSSQLHERIEHLSLTQNGITSNGLRGFLSADLSNLKQLNLGQNKVGQTGISYLVKSKLPKLKRLDIWSCELTNQSIKHLCKTRWPNLKELQITLNVDVTPNCLEYLLQVDFKLQKLRTSFDKKLSIHYFSTIVRSSTASGQLEVLIRIKEDQMFKGIEAFVNANVKLTRKLPF